MNFPNKGLELPRTKSGPCFVPDIWRSPHDLVRGLSGLEWLPNRWVQHFGIIVASLTIVIVKQASIDAATAKLGSYNIDSRAAASMVSSDLSDGQLYHIKSYIRDPIAS